MPQLDREKLWKNVLTELELIVSKANFTTWFQNTDLLEIRGDTVFLGVPNSFTQEWIRNKYHKFIVRCFRNLEPSIKTIEYTICSQPLNIYKKTSIKYKTETPLPKEAPQMEFNELYENEDSLNPRYSLDNFIVGSFNELAHAAALAITKNPGNSYNPLFVYGGVGLGKTHLLQATGNKIKESHPHIKAKYTTSEKLTNGIIQAIQSGPDQIYEFKESYKKYDLLIIDDIQFLAGKPKTQEEFFHIFNALYEKNKQIIFSSDRAPKAIPDLEERLRSRFEGGMMADISEPEYESKLAILKSKMFLKNITLSDEIIDFIANNTKNNIRELEGSLNLLGAQITLLNKNLSLQEVKDIFNKNTFSKKKITFGKIIKTVSEFYEIEEQNIFEKSRKKEFVLPRQIAMYLLREDFNGSYPYIGQKFGGRDHTTVIHAYEKISEDLKKNQNLKDNIGKIRELLFKQCV